ncbi:MAG: hypothetical protein WD060_08885 [Pirellulales bacterium]
MATFDGTAWRVANDPQPGASGSMGSLMPPLGDELVKRLDVPVGFRAVLWHQGESDSHQKNASRTLRGTLYTE